MKYLKLNISRLCYQLDISGLRREIRKRLVKQFALFLNGNGNTPRETVDIIPVKMEKRYRIDPRIENLIRKNLETLSRKFPFPDNPDQVVGKWIKSIATILGNREFDLIVRKIKNPDDIIIFPVKKGCLVRDPNSLKSYLFLMTRLLRGVSISSVCDAIYFTSALAFPSVDSIMLHGVGIKDRENGYMFLGLSGSGKTTIANLSSGKDIISDDGIIVERDRSGFSMSASPIDQTSIQGDGSGGNRHGRAGLSMGFLLVKDNKNFLEKLLPENACSIILKNHIHYFRYFPNKGVEKTFYLISDLCRRVPFYLLHFKKDASFWRSIEYEISRDIKSRETGNEFE
jgi:hypothetical protein